MALRVIGIGDNVVDKYLNTSIMYPGGNALNFAVYAKMLGANSAYMGRYGTDAAGMHNQEVLKKMCVDQSHCKVLEGENGFACITLVNGDRTFIRSNKGGVLHEHPIILTDDDLNYLLNFQLIHSSINSYLEDELPKLKSIGVPLSFDFSSRGTDEYFQKVCPYLDYGIASCGESTPKETNEKIEKLFSFGCKQVVATMGKDGAIFFDGEEKITYVPTYVKATDTLGAGDSFLTAFLLSYEQWKLTCGADAQAVEKKQAVIAAMKVGSNFAAKTCMIDGAFGNGLAFANPV